MCTFAFLKKNADIFKMKFCSYSVFPIDYTGCSKRNKGEQGRGGGGGERGSQNSGILSERMF